MAKEVDALLVKAHRQRGHDFMLEVAQEYVPKNGIDFNDFGAMSKWRDRYEEYTDRACKTVKCKVT